MHPSIGLNLQDSYTGRFYGLGDADANALLLRGTMPHKLFGAPHGAGHRPAAGGPGRPALRLLVLHDDPQREFDYVAGAEKSLELARAQGWTVISMKNDWKCVFA